VPGVLLAGAGTGAVAHIIALVSERRSQATAPSLAANTWSEKRSAGAVLHATPERSDTMSAGRPSGLSPPDSGRETERSKAAGARAVLADGVLCEVGRGCVAEWRGAF